MAGITHTAFRRVLAELGGVGLFSTEMLSARSLPGEDRFRSPYLISTPQERPLSYQLLVAAPEELPPAIEALHRLSADAIDLNLGCPAPDVRKRGAGSRLMERPQVARNVAAKARALTRLPLTAKIRLGERLDETGLREFCLMLEGEGVDLLAVHARLRGEPYGRRPRWEWVAKVKSWVSVPVVANGGIFSAAEAEACRAATGCNGLMLARGAVVKPWLPAEVAREVYGVPGDRLAPDLPAVYRRFVELLTESFPPETRLGRLKEFTRYFGENYSFGHNLVVAVQSSSSLEKAVGRAEAFFVRNEGTPGGGRDRHRASCAAARPGSCCKAFQPSQRL
jgi:tRNA-dihydrouridine synthase B